jgi:hypothetical protein
VAPGVRVALLRHALAHLAPVLSQVPQVVAAVAAHLLLALNSAERHVADAHRDDGDTHHPDHDPGEGAPHVAHENHHHHAGHQRHRHDRHQLPGAAVLDLGQLRRFLQVEVAGGHLRATASCRAPEQHRAHQFVLRRCGSDRTTAAGGKKFDASLNCIARLPLWGA